VSKRALAPAVGAVTGRLPLLVELGAAVAAVAAVATLATLATLAAVAVMMMMPMERWDSAKAVLPPPATTLAEM